MSILKQSTAATIKLGPFVDDGDGKTAETGLTISQADIRLSKAGGDFAQTNNAAGATHDENGYYDVPLDTTDTNTLGRLRVAVHESGALPVWQDFVVVTANVFDSLVGGGDLLDVEAPTGMALEATLTAMKGSGWTDETLVAILTAVEAISAGSGATAEEVWAYAARTLTQSAAAVASAVAGSTITATRGDTLSAALTDIGALTNYSKIWFTVKADDADTDAESLVQIELSDGLKYINGAAAVTAGNGSITIDDEATGDITIVIEAVETAKLSPGSYHYDIQILRSTGIAVSTLSSGTFIVSADYTRAVA